MKIFNVCLILLFLVFGFIACDPNNGNNDPVCECIEKIHEGNCPSPCTGKGIPPCTCSDPEPVCNCPNETNHYVDEEPCCNNLNCSCTFTKKRDCNCTINLHLVGEICCDQNVYNCTCETNIAGERLANGIPITNRYNVDRFDEIVLEILDALEWLLEQQRDYVLDHVKEIKIIFGTQARPFVDIDNVLIVGNDMGANDIWDVLDEWVCENMVVAYLDNGTPIYFGSGVILSASDVVEKIKAGIDLLNIWGYDFLANYCMENIQIIRIINGAGVVEVILEDNIWTAIIGENATIDTIATVFGDFAEQNI